MGQRVRSESEISWDVERDAVIGGGACCWVTIMLPHEMRESRQRRIYEKGGDYEKEQ